MLQALGSTEQVSSGHPCCDVCNDVPHRLYFESLPSNFPLHNSCRRAIRKVDKALEDKLKDNLKVERQSYIQDHPSFLMLGPNFVCPDSAIDKICHEAKFVTSLEDLYFVSIHSDIKSRFLKVILSTLSAAPTPHRSTLRHHHTRNHQY